ncbi:MAG: hypothetical protein DWH91_04845 [Planctomycetota bacterium]|nr:MAG: hypothetical protein DWH91_04845 [Planctomycetota bacterium]
MSSVSRRDFLAAAAGGLTSCQLGRSTWAAEPGEALQLATFRWDVTPPVGHSLCGGWITPVVAVDTPLQAIGLVIQGAGRPIVICSVDWTGILNSAHVALRTALAEAAGTTPDRVAVQCVHPHNAPFACLDAQKIVSQYTELPPIVDEAFFARCLTAGQQALREALPKAQPLTHMASSKSLVREVAANRRILGVNGQVRASRSSSCQDPALRAEPEGLIDPWLRTAAFYHGERRLAACHYYACHPMSYYGDGRVTPDFCGLARDVVQESEPDCTHLYFNGCGGNIGAGKYNDGSPPMRPILRDRIRSAIDQNLRQLTPQPLTKLAWATCEILPVPQSTFDAEQIARQIADPRQSVVNRNRPAYTLAWLQRCTNHGPPIVLSGLHLNEVVLAHLPAECFVEYQLQAQAQAPDRFVACAAYGDGGPWYLPTRAAYPQGGYEVSVAWCDPAVEDVLTTGISRILKPVDAPG